MFKHILAAVDGSAHSLRAADLAIGLAKSLGAKLSLVHVARTLSVPDSLRGYMKSENIGGEPIFAIDEATRRAIEDVKARAQKEGVKKVTVKFREGRPARSIVALAEADGADAIVLGSRGLSDLEAALLGSVSHKVANLAACTVIVAK